MKIITRQEGGLMLHILIDLSASFRRRQLEIVTQFIEDPQQSTRSVANLCGNTGHNRSASADQPPKTHLPEEEIRLQISKRSVTDSPISLNGGKYPKKSYFFRKTMVFEQLIEQYPTPTTSTLSYCAIHCQAYSYLVYVRAAQN
ncbi:hypothetical protein J6590_050395 [Homalodisca vitripennis]|nr:hypothetical protein J6590_050395 [Homalodisca vitripennis]